MGDENDAEVGLPADADVTIVPAAIVELLLKTRPWVLFGSLACILFAISFGIQGLGDLMAMVKGQSSFLTGLTFEIPNGVAIVLVLSLVFMSLFQAVCFFMIGGSLFKFRREAALMKTEPTMDRLAGALGSMRKSWKVVGIATIFPFFFMILYFVVMMILVSVLPLD